MFYKITEIRNNVDSVNSYTIDVYSIHQGFIKLLKLADKVNWNEELREEVLVNHFETNRNYSKILNRYALALAKVITSVEFKGNDESLLGKINELKNNIDNQELVVSQMQNIFDFLKLKGKSMDLVKLVDNFDLFSEEALAKVNKQNFDFEPVSGCDLPE
ncbi:hypothetical protein [Mycoplasma buteonis]|uniref:hypothetical protein n=1 Tax=Mycoplasma buteonis TaxID=171280 RepID=UPI0005698EE4|nr:hypothetical protein [Mycoplasma buteonis]